MWLLNVSNLRLEFFEGEAIIDYAILSHTWGAEEVTFDDMKRPLEAQQKSGYTKITFTCEQAKKHGLPYVWIDTCCINKDSSAELSESINSMFRWYHQAEVCYVYLSDVPGGLPERFQQLNTFRGSIGVTAEGSRYVESNSNYADTQESWVQYVRRAIEKSRWFTRGWTLQELIAPFTVEFYDQEWGLLGTKEDLLDALSNITSIDKRVLENMGNLQTISVAQRMSWAAKRVTKRPEDEAYALMGIFDINMPMLYGEGKKAFIRLQEEIIRKSVDHSIFAWKPWEPFSQTDLLLSPSPYGFRAAGNFQNSSVETDIDDSYVLTNRGLRITLRIFAGHAGIMNSRYLYARLNTFAADSDRTEPLFLRLLHTSPLSLPSAWLSSNSPKRIWICEVSRPHDGAEVLPPYSDSDSAPADAAYQTIMVKRMKTSDPTQAA